jgi:hypothetical protein
VVACLRLVSGEGEKEIEEKKTREGIPSYSDE